MVHKLSDFGLPVLNIKLLTKKAKMPVKAYEDDAAYDLYTTEDIILEKNVPALVPTGLAMEIPNGHEVQIWPRSSGTMQGFYIHPGTVDAGYRGEVMIIVTNLGETKLLDSGHRIAQMKFVKLDYCSLKQVNHLGTSDRKTGGMGSTGE
jgi:dUTP pyrophosphatase